MLWAIIITGLVVLNASIALQIVLLWAMPVLTLTNLLQKIRSFAEHGGATEHTDQDHEWTYSWKAGWLGRLTIWPYNINRHREHHAKPNIPWHQLSEQALNANGDLDSSGLFRHLMRKNHARAD